MPLWTLTKKFRFEAAHVLPLHEGKCSRLHGHSWNGKVLLSHTSLKTEGSETDMLTDFAIIGKVVKKMVETHLDHFYLNESLSMQNPTSEKVAEWVFRFLDQRLPHLAGVVIEETCTSACHYEPDFNVAVKVRA